MYKIYIYRNDVNSKVYIGQTKTTLEQRAQNGNGYQGCTHFYNAIQKYGWSKFHGAILEDGLTAQEANIREQYWINYFQSNNDKYGYNICSGGNNLTGIRRNSRSKKVYCLEEQRWFNSLSEAAEWAGLTKNGGPNIGLAAKGDRTYAGKHPITGIPLHWSYSDNNPITRSKKTKGIPVINITKNIIYKSIEEAVKDARVSRKTIIRSCELNIPAGRDKCQWAYY